MRVINSPSDLDDFAHEYGLREDWHEPDEQDISVSFSGTSFDNAFGAGGNEKCVHLKHEGREVAVVNLANLFAWAATGDVGA